MHPKYVTLFLKPRFLSIQLVALAELRAEPPGIAILPSAFQISSYKGIYSGVARAA